MHIANFTHQLEHLKSHFANHHTSVNHAFQVIIVAQARPNRYTADPTDIQQNYLSHSGSIHYIADLSVTYSGSMHHIANLSIT